MTRRNRNSAVLEIPARELGRVDHVEQLGHVIGNQTAHQHGAVRIPGVIGVNSHDQLPCFTNVFIVKPLLSKLRFGKGRVRSVVPASASRDWALSAPQAFPRQESRLPLAPQGDHHRVVDILAFHELNET